MPHRPPFIGGVWGGGVGGAVGELGRLPLGPLPGLLQNPVPGRASPRAQLPAQARPGAACQASLSPVAYGPGRAHVGPNLWASDRATVRRAALVYTNGYFSSAAPRLRGEGPSWTTCLLSI